MTSKKKTHILLLLMSKMNMNMNLKYIHTYGLMVWVCQMIDILIDWLTAWWDEFFSNLKTALPIIRGSDQVRLKVVDVLVVVVVLAVVVVVVVLVVVVVVVVLDIWLCFFLWWELHIFGGSYTHIHALRISILNSKTAIRQRKRECEKEKERN